MHADSEWASAQYPVLQWFMEESVYQDMITNHRCDDVDANATFVWNGTVLDGGLMHIKGHSTCFAPKAKWDVELPAGYTFDFGAPFSYPLKGWDMQNENSPRQRVGWETLDQAGIPAAKYQAMRVQRNGSFHGNFGIIENFDGTWRNAHGFGNSPFYKVEARGLRTYASPALLAASGDVVKKNPDDGDYTDIWELTQKLAPSRRPRQDQMAPGEPRPSRDRERLRAHRPAEAVGHRHLQLVRHQEPDHRPLADHPLGHGRHLRRHRHEERPDDHPCSWRTTPGSGNPSSRCRTTRRCTSGGCAPLPTASTPATVW
ncbi:MAG: hypothetical protein IPL94_08125 [Tetrasphaera sp.]|nr:hypothetical protein [Tetrasphaera sp.]